MHFSMALSIDVNLFMQKFKRSNKHIPKLYFQKKKILYLKMFLAPFLQLVGQEYVLSFHPHNIYEEFTSLQ